MVTRRESRCALKEEWNHHTVVAANIPGIPLPQKYVELLSTYKTYELCLSFPFMGRSFFGFSESALIRWLIPTTSSDLWPLRGSVGTSGFPCCLFTCSLCNWCFWGGISAGSFSQINAGEQKSHSGKGDIVLLPLMFREGNLLLGTS